ncbi:4Fe-4S dicluster domain-containing protein [Xenophilus aerolatus]|nr:4Fe-4S dicluster domain-containing protein [Xenophilus aerolatus]
MGWQPAIDPARCTGCGWCVASCEPHVLALEAVEWRKRSVLQDAARCTGCSDCAVTCPFHAITMVRAPRAGLMPRD